jgi:thioredoxin 1
MSIVHLTDHSFWDAIQVKGLVLVTFWAPWCAYCRMISPVLEELSEEMCDKLAVAKLNIDDNPLTADAFGVVNRDIPMLKLFKDGREIDTLVVKLFKDGREIDTSVGFQGKARLKHWVLKHPDEIQGLAELTEKLESVRKEIVAASDKVETRLVDVSQQLRADIEKFKDNINVQPQAQQEQGMEIHRKRDSIWSNIVRHIKKSPPL